MRNSIAQTVVGGKYLVSTIQLPFSLLYEYETMVFTCDVNGKVTNWSDLSCRRNFNLAGASAEHKALVSLYEGK